MGKSSSSSKSSEAALRKMNKLVSSLLNKSDTAPFREPVDWRSLELWDYPKIVPHPMDLGTIKRKLESNSYATAFECAEDIRLVWTNCMTYNEEGSDFFLLAGSLSRKFEDRYRKIKSEYDTGEGSVHGNLNEGDQKQDKVPSLDAKTQFASNIFKVGGDALGHVMSVIDLRCPNAIERGINGKDDELEINVDALDVRTFKELDEFLQDQVTHIGRRNVTEKASGKRKK